MPVRPDSGSDESLRLLADAGTLLISSLDSERTLSNLANLLVPRFADWCVVDMADGEGNIRRMVVVSDDPAHDELVSLVMEHREVDTSATVGSPEVIRTGNSIFAATIGPDDIDKYIAMPELREAYRKAGLSSLMILPIQAKGKVCGAIHFALMGAGARYTSSDLLIAQDLARRAGQAIDNARNYEEMQRIADELRRANEAKDEFLGLISHELRTPITVIHGGARILRLRGDSLPPEIREELVTDIEGEANRLHRIVENLLALSRAELTSYVALEPVLLNRMAQQMADSYTLGRRDRVINVDVASEIGPVAADPGFVEQILRNLYSNADKYSPTDQPVDVRVSVKDGKGLLEVMDRGPGVAEEELETIFERFYRTEKAQQGPSGAGLGLAVCRRLAEAMSGEIWASLREGGGMVMSVSIPLYEEGSE